MNADMLSNGEAMKFKPRLDMGVAYSPSGLVYPKCGRKRVRRADICVFSWCEKTVGSSSWRSSVFVVWKQGGRIHSVSIMITKLLGNVSRRAPINVGEAWITRSGLKLWLTKSGKRFQITIPLGELGFELKRREEVRMDKLTKARFVTIHEGLYSADESGELWEQFRGNWEGMDDTPETEEELKGMAQDYLDRRKKASECTHTEE